MAELVNKDDLFRLIEQDEALYMASGTTGDCMASAAYSSEKREARGIETEGTRELAVYMASIFAQGLVQGASLSMILAATFLSGFDLGIAAAIEAETRRQAETS